MRASKLPRQYPAQAWLLTEMNIRAQAGGWCPEDPADVAFLAGYLDAQALQREIEQKNMAARMNR